MIWEIDHLELGDQELIQAARNYGFTGATPQGAAQLLKRWGYRVRKLHVPKVTKPRPKSH